ncbi:restriction endonuclease subunit S [Mycolicibacterium alvei]|uniref:Restriction modification system DNA specificity domain-containing protein n=1 Tax=Mycolicibacterium alvei TaxID=67081 RepID=A0A6N4UIP1_9MYCO|nr:restriction endonuclease subunit S [Mycolicibacterium alvei]MCV6998779.1 restriction endonuclease subunit S [Mycolicibacterium alvei]BBX25026.1 restriction modification system DNA specificity domain-containing protein [Mycolicibacterium alvei]
MSRIDDLIAKRCPNGVEFVRLGDVVRIRNGRDYKSLGVGDVPVYGTGGVMTYVDTAAYAEPSVLIPRKGSLDKLYYVDVPFWTVDTIFYTEIGEQVVPKFLYYYLLTQHLDEMNQAGGVPSLTQTMLNPLPIPLPPIEVQQEIVRVLDTFQRLEAELEAELEARRRQHAHYSSTLLTFGSDVPLVPMRELCKISRGRVISRDYLRDNEGPYPVYSSQTQNHGIFGFIDSYDYDFESITWTTDGANAGSVFFHTDEKFSITNVCGLLRVVDQTIVSTRYIYYQLAKRAKAYVSAGMGNPKLMAGPMGTIEIPVPPLEEQDRIVSIIDKFDLLVNDTAVGIVAELNARRKQYEYYRDRLLTFEELVA